MRRTFGILLFVALTGCSGTDPENGDDTDRMFDSEPVDSPADSDVRDVDTAPVETAEEPPAVFEATDRIQITSLALSTAEGAGRDWDGDNQPDNQLPATFAAMGALPGVFTVPELNEAITQILADEDEIVLLDMANSSPLTMVAVLRGLRDGDGNLGIDPSSVDETGYPLTLMDGPYLDAANLFVGPDSLSLTFDVLAQSFPTAGPLVLTADRAFLEGTMGLETFNGELHCAFLVSQIMTDVVDPILTASGLNTGTYRTLAKGILDAQSDITIGGQNALSGTFTLQGTKVAE